MPPRAVKRGGAASGAKRTTRSAKKTPNQAPPDAVIEQPAKVEESLEEAVAVEEEKPIEEDKLVLAEKSSGEVDVKEVEADVTNGSISGMSKFLSSEFTEINGYLSSFGCCELLF